VRQKEASRTGTRDESEVEVESGQAVGAVEEGEEEAVRPHRPLEVDSVEGNLAARLSHLQLHHHLLSRSHARLRLQSEAATNRPFVK